ncbi:trimethylamine methyltransferase family protein [Thioclava sp. FR2]|uniref:trimethylamine methyltransferase family protein n=1 Tax=Thioclava sp. FR2 TaxID=3445780 RepID=UPI003EBD6A9B
MARTCKRTARMVDYVDLRHPFTPQKVRSEDGISALHKAALDLLETAGMKILLPEAIDILQKAGAWVDGDMVFIGRDLVAEALRTARQSLGACAPVQPSMNVFTRKVSFCSAPERVAQT